MMSRDEFFMNQALKLALRAKARTSPNPMVGALLVKNNRVIARGYHKKAGGPHAEVEAIEQAGANARGCTLYVTLEPCAHYGRTAPCVDKILASGIRRVVVGMVDPNPLNNGRGIDILKAGAVEVRVGFLEGRLRKMNEAFIKYITKKMPFVTVKVGQSLDGKIASRSGDSKWITSDKAREFAHALRSGYDACMVGVNTIIRDDPFLTAGLRREPLTRIIVDSKLSTPADAKLFQRPGEVIIATLHSAAGQETENRNLLSRRARIVEVKENNGQVNLHDLLKHLARMEIANVLVEGGGSLIGSLFDSGLVDKVLFFIAPKIIGGKDSISSVMGRGISAIDRAVRLTDVGMNRIGEDYLFSGYVVRANLKN